jgi:MarR family transcriptional regulator, organic hydroperoxide resistance regulator
MSFCVFNLDASNLLMPQKILKKNIAATTQVSTGTRRAFEPSPSDRLTHLMREADKRLVRALQKRLARHKVAHGHWIFLRILWENDGISQTALSQLAGVMNASTSGAVQGMEKLGYIVRKQHSDNRKKVFVYLTPVGRALEKKLVPLAIETNELATKGFSKIQIANFRHALIAAIRNLDSEEFG